MYCSNGICAVGEICCFNPVAVGDHCGLTGQCGAGYVEFTCNGPVDCPGQVCCATRDPQTKTYTGITCTDTCILTNELVVCDSNVDCAAGKTCAPVPTLGAGYKDCN